MTKWIYTERINLTPELVADVIKLAHQYLLLDLFELCEDYLLQYLDKANAVFLLNISYVFEASKLIGPCLQIVIPEFLEYAMSNSVDILPLALQTRLFKEVLPTHLHITIPTLLSNLKLVFQYVVQIRELESWLDSNHSKLEEFDQLSDEEELSSQAENKEEMLEKVKRNILQLQFCDPLKKVKDEAINLWWKVHYKYEDALVGKEEHEDPEEYGELEYC